jgi:hypothetical protein
MPRSQPWSKAELEQFLQLAGDVPRPMLANTYNAWARRNGYSSRTQKALQVKADHYKVSLRAVGSWVTTGGLAAILGLRPSTVESWLGRYPDLPRKTFGRQLVRYVNRQQLKSWVVDHLHLLGGIEHSRLVMLFGDEELADRICAEYPNRPAGLEATARPVRCVDDGRVWPSIMAAAREIYVAHSSLWRALLEQRPVVGMRFEWVDQQ